MEITAHAETLIKSNDLFMQVGGLTMEVDKAGPLFNKVQNLEVGGEAVDAARCYKVVTSLLVASQLELVKKATVGLLKIEPKHKGCTTPITDMTPHIVDRDASTPPGFRSSSPGRRWPPSSPACPTPTATRSPTSPPSTARPRAASSSSSRRVGASVSRGASLDRKVQERTQQQPSKRRRSHV
jgi:hypothetical protein